ncbi:GPI transamidase GAA1 [Phycomyces blakesleeanus]|uniref:GPI transamidase GAA1 n=1 Tax=Phycomyces blakesleeanus TaxID=4837 RepID=A0ABR3BDZ5_PHYBL
MLLSRIKAKLTGKRVSSEFSLEKQRKIAIALEKYIPILSIILFVVAVIWLFLLPYEGYNKRTYISENALLPGQANVNYGYNDMRAAEDYRSKIIRIQDKDSEMRASFIQEELRRIGFTSALQHFSVNGLNETGVNAFAIHRAPRSDGKEALILSAPWVSRTGDYNTNGIAALLSLAKLFKRNIYWSKDIILLVTDKDLSGTQAWLDAYHGITQSEEIDKAGFSSVVMPRSGAVQGAINLDFPGTNDYESLGLFFEGVNGQLPNLDLINSIVVIARHTAQISVVLHDTTSNSYEEKSWGVYAGSLLHMLRTMKYQALCHPSSDAGLYLRYKIDAITVHGIHGSGDLNHLFGFHRIGVLVESTFRSLNNLLEHFHQSFFFYFLPQPNRYVSIETTGNLNTEYPPAFTVKKKNVSFAFSILGATHLAGVLIFYVIQPIFGQQFLRSFPMAEIVHGQFIIACLIAFTTVTGLSLWVTKNRSTTHSGAILKSFCLAQSALIIATVSLLNFSLAVATAITIALPYSIIRPSPNSAARLAQWLIITLTSPAGLVTLFTIITGNCLTSVLTALFADFQVAQSWFLTYICIVYWPINMAMCILIVSNS